MATLYRNYRPNNFSEVLGQNHVKITLQNEISSGHLGHSYLFCGPRAVGKTTIARILAKAINCENRKDGEFEPCDKCQSCLSTKAGKNLDVVEIDAASNTGVENVRENIISFSRLSPKGKYKIFIIDEVHMLSINAFNALLKIMEEPPAYVVFILCTTEIHKVPSTVISRCERFDFKKISVIEIIKKLKKISVAEKIEVAEEVLMSVARQSGGYLRDAESLFSQILSLGGKKITSEQAELIIPKNNSKEAIDIISLMIKKDTAKAISLLNKIIDNGVNVKNFNKELIILSRKILLDKVNPGLSDSLGLDLEEEMEKKIIEIVNALSISDISSILNKFINASYDKRNFLIPQLSLEMAIVEYCYLKDPNVVNNNISSINNTSKPSYNNTNISSPNVVKNTNNYNNTNNVVNKNEEVLAKVDKEDAVKTEEKKPVIENTNNGSSLSFSFDDVCQKWPEFLVKIRNSNHALSFIMQSCQPSEIKDGRICLTFKYKFHQDRLHDKSIQETVRKNLAEVFNADIKFKSEFDENMDISKTQNMVINDDNEEKEEKKEIKQEGKMLNNLLNTFGGEVLG